MNWKPSLYLKMTLPLISLPRDYYVSISGPSKNRTTTCSPLFTRMLRCLSLTHFQKVLWHPLAQGPPTCVNEGVLAYSKPRHGIRSETLPSQLSRDTGRSWQVQMEQQRAHSEYKKRNGCRFLQTPACKHTGFLT